MMLSEYRNSMDDLNYRLCTTEDIELITSYRMKLWKVAGKFSGEEEYNDIYNHNRNYFKDKFEKDRIVVPAYFDRENRIAAIGIGVIIEKPVINWENRGLEGYIFNMNTDEKFRRRGLASSIVDDIISFFKDRRVKKVSLTSNNNSFSLYKQKGMVTNSFYQEIVIK